MHRTKNSIKNTITEYLSVIFIVVLNFVIRTVFARYFGKEYMGITGLFTNLITFLSLADMGLGTAILYKLYKPIEEDDKPRIMMLMDFYRRIFFKIGMVVLGIGAIMIPFLPYIVKDYETFARLGISGVMIFVLYLLRTCFSYWFIYYKTAIVEAHQKKYVLTMAGYIVFFVKAALEIVALVVLHSFILYTVLEVLAVIVQNLIYARIAGKMYPYINEKTENRLPKNEVREIYKDCFALFLYKSNAAIINSSDNIVLSATLGLEAVGVYSNYYMFTSTAKTFLRKFHEGICASLGSLHASGKVEDEKRVFGVVQFLTYLMYGVTAVGIAVLGNDFISVWLGDDYVEGVYTWGGHIVNLIPILIGLELYFFGYQSMLSNYRASMGIFQQMKWKPIVSSVVNVGVSIMMIPYLGIAGVIVGTISSAVSCDLFLDAHLIFKHGLRLSEKKYHATNLLYLGATLVSFLAANRLCEMLPAQSWRWLILKGLICLLVFTAVAVVAFHRLPPMRFLFGFVKKIIHRRS